MRPDTRRKRIQFRHGLGLGRFLQCYGSEPECADAQLPVRWQQSWVCLTWGACSQWRLPRYAPYQGSRCKAHVSLLAGTLCTDTRLLLTPWLLALDRLTHDQHSFSFLELVRQLGATPNPARKPRRRVQRARRTPEKGPWLRSMVQVGHRERRGGRQDSWQDAVDGGGGAVSGGVPSRLTTELRIWLPPSPVEPLGWVLPLAQIRAGGRPNLLEEPARDRLCAPGNGGRWRPLQLRGASPAWVNTLHGNIERPMAGACHRIDAGLCLTVFRLRLSLESTREDHRDGKNQTYTDTVSSIGRHANIWWIMRSMQ